MQEQLVCGGCKNTLMYPQGATNVCCALCNFITLAPPQAPNAQINCGHCRITLMYPHGASYVICALCQYITNVNMSNGRVLPSINRPNGSVTPPTGTSTSNQTQTVVVENPMSMNERGKLVSNVMVGVTTNTK